MEVTIKWFALLLFCFKTSLCSADYNEVVIEDLCKDGNAIVILETDKMGVGMLKATSHFPYKPDKNCSIIIKPPADHGIVLSVHKIDMRKSGNSCQDHIKVYHSDRRTSPAIICHYPSDLKEKDSYFSKEPMTIVYHTSPALFPELTNEEGFSLTYAVVADDSDSEDDWLHLHLVNNLRIIVLVLYLCKFLIWLSERGTNEDIDKSNPIRDSNSEDDRLHLHLVIITVRIIKIVLYLCILIIQLSKRGTNGDIYFL